MNHPIDPVNLAPIPPLIDSYVYHSTPHKDTGAEGWIMGIDEAGRGRESGWSPSSLRQSDLAVTSRKMGASLTAAVLGPMVYAAAYCPMGFKKTLEGLGFDGKSSPFGSPSTPLCGVTHRFSPFHTHLRPNIDHNRDRCLYQTPRRFQRKLGRIYGKHSTFTPLCVILARRCLLRASRQGCYGETQSI